MVDKDLDYCRNDECECCWEFNNGHSPGKYREDYEMIMCDDCLYHTECNS